MRLDDNLSDVKGVKFSKYQERRVHPSSGTKRFGPPHSESAVSYSIQDVSFHSWPLNLSAEDIPVERYR